MTQHTRQKKIHRKYILKKIINVHVQCHNSNF